MPVRISPVPPVAMDGLPVGLIQRRPSENRNQRSITLKNDTHMIVFAGKRTGSFDADPTTFRAQSSEPFPRHAESGSSDRPRP